MNTWFLIADGDRAQLYSRETPQSPLKEVDGWDNKGGKLQDHITEVDELGSSRDEPAHTGAVNTAGNDPKRHVQGVFAKELADILKIHQANYEALVVVASPKVLGDLRQAFDSVVKNKITQEFSKDLTHLAPHELAEHLDNLMATKA